MMLQTLGEETFSQSCEAEKIERKLEKIGRKLEKIQRKLEKNK
jgi:hypothetical protein